MGVAFFLTALLVVLAPGTGVVYTVATGLGRGRAMSVAAAFGCTLGIVPSILASVFGVAALFNRSAALFSAVKWAGAAYLLWLAFRSLRASGPMRFDTAPGADGRGAYWVARTGFLINTLNPKLTVFFFALLPQFLNPAAGPVAGQMLAMGGAFMAMTFAVFVVYGVLASQARAFVLSSERASAWLRRTVALIFAAFTVRLAFSER